LVVFACDVSWAASSLASSNSCSIVAILYCNSIICDRDLVLPLRSLSNSDSSSAMVSACSLRMAELNLRIPSASLIAFSSCIRDAMLQISLLLLLLTEEFPAPNPPKRYFVSTERAVNATEKLSEPGAVSFNCSISASNSSRCFSHCNSLSFINARTLCSSF